MLCYDYAHPSTKHSNEPVRHYSIVHTNILAVTKKTLKTTCNTPSRRILYVYIFARMCLKRHSHQIPWPVVLTVLHCLTKIVLLVKIMVYSFLSDSVIRPAIYSDDVII